MASSGPNAFTSITGTSWTSPSNAGADDSSYATYQLIDGGGGCFLAGTIISYPDNQSYAIEKVRINDSIIDIYNNKVNVENIFIHNVDSYLHIVTNVSEVMTTYEHPFLINDTWLEAGYLKVGDYLSDMRIIHIEDVREKVYVYNLRVDGSRTYIANNFKVHNK